MGARGLMLICSFHFPLLRFTAAGRKRERKRKNKNYFCPEGLSPNSVTLPCQPQDTFLLGWLCEILYFMAVFLMILFLKTISAAFCSRFLQSPLGRRRSDPLLNGAVRWFQDELSDFTGSKSATPMSTTASDVEREDGSSKSAEVQAAPGTRSISVGRLQTPSSSRWSFFGELFFSNLHEPRWFEPALFVLLRRPAWQRGQHRRAGHHRVHARARHGCDRLQALQVETLVQVVFFCVFFLACAGRHFLSCRPTQQQHADQRHREHGVRPQHRLPVRGAVVRGHRNHRGRGRRGRFAGWVPAGWAEAASEFCACDFFLFLLLLVNKHLRWEDVQIIDVFKTLSIFIYSELP